MPVYAHFYTSPASNTVTCAQKYVCVFVYLMNSNHAVFLIYENGCNEFLL